MKHLFTTIKLLSSNPWCLWVLFGTGFILPVAFLPFLLLAAISAWNALKREYRDVEAYWGKRVSDVSETWIERCGESYMAERPKLSVHTA